MYLGFLTSVYWSQPFWSFCIKFNAVLAANLNPIYSNEEKT